ncbi:hypothetical protein [Mesorhizobium sp. LNHC252B00]|uniref:hypothetical protein n=1 Tax=Mesorhizobium sp. LNHC252B00 TaxID=1287252 RepID=UPI001FD99DA1|nr:hypothetical protein [Mesorhizobium sp. LNHC252B00]
MGLLVGGHAGFALRLLVGLGRSLALDLFALLRALLAIGHSSCAVGAGLILRLLLGGCASLALGLLLGSAGLALGLLLSLRIGLALGLLFGLDLALRPLAHIGTLLTFGGTHRAFGIAARLVVHRLLRLGECRPATDAKRQHAGDQNAFHGNSP